MGLPRIARLHLSAFKSYMDQEFEVAPLTLLIGRNGSGKSNALDALSLLALLADGRSLKDLDRDDQEVAGLRGGLSGSAPFGRGEIRLGVDVDLGDGTAAHMRIVLDPAQFEVVSERLDLVPTGKRTLTLLEATRTAPGSGLAEARVYSGGAPRTYTMLSGRLLTHQIATVVPGDSKGRRLVLDTASTVMSVLTGVFVLDPVPATMREYVRVGSPPNRSGSTPSAQ